MNVWCRWQNKRAQAVDVGLTSLTTGLEAGLIVPSDAADAFDVSYARWLAPLLIDASPPLVGFSAVEHEHLLSTFRALDERLLGLAAKVVRATASAVIPRKSESDAIPGFGVLRREVQNTRGSTPVRKLVSQMGDALTRLTPCLMMSPHSVAQFLGTESAKFDLVVFDEASQIAVWDAMILAVASEAGCSLLLSEDYNEGFAWRGVTVVNPFATTPHALLARAMREERA